MSIVGLVVSDVGLVVSSVGSVECLEKFETMAKKFVQAQLSNCNPRPMPGLVCDCKLC